MPSSLHMSKNVIRGGDDDGGHFNCYIVEVRFFNA